MTTIFADNGAGFRPLFAKENRKWWGTSRWWLQLLLWVVVLNGLLATILFVLPTVTTPDGEPVMPESPIDGGIQIFFGLGALALAIAIPVLMQDEIIGEKLSGTADWILSKPVARSAFILSKAGAHALNVTLLLVIIPALGAYGLFTLAEPGAVAFVPFVLATGLTLLHTLFYLTLALLLGVLVTNRGLVLGATIGFFFTGQFVSGFVPVFDMLTPWMLPKIAIALVMDASLPVWMLLPVAMTAGWIIAFLLIALWRFQRSE
jgi:ABC-2 type transport system permease protein